MSLTEEQKTAKNFHEFYSMIRPYLNGSFPTPIVNKFSKGDLYSTEEKIIGQWIDGKPLWQKTVQFTTSKTFPANTWSTLDTMSNGGNIAKVVMYRDGGLGNTTGVCTLAMESNFDNNNLNVIVGTPANSIYAYTIQYTKTTDSPISIGDGNDYSTDEQVVGTWIDGKPLYQKTVDCGALFNDTTWHSVAHGVSNFGKLISMNGVCVDSSNNGFDISLSLITAFSQVVHAEIQGDTIQFFSGADRGSQWRLYVTIQYTKTTD